MLGSSSIASLANTSGIHYSLFNQGEPTYVSYNMCWRPIQRNIVSGSYFSVKYNHEYVKIDIALGESELNT